MLSARSIWFLIGWFLVGMVVYLSLTPSPPKPPAFPFDDKVFHFFNYFLLMLWFAVGFKKGRSRLLFAVGFILMGIALEFLQGLIPTRYFDFFDMLANSVGVLAGLLLSSRLYIIPKIISKSREAK